MRVELVREGAVISLPPELWRAILAVARQQGWRPTDNGPNVRDAEARVLAQAIEAAINAHALGDELERELSRLVALVNFMRNGAFLIR